jgi:hypothetical protein
LPLAADSSALCGLANYQRWIQEDTAAAMIRPVVFLVR